jgi:hypothetical protein
MANKPKAHVLATYLYFNLALQKDSCSMCTDMETLTVALHIWFVQTHKNKHQLFSLTKDSSGCLFRWPAV